MPMQPAITVKDLSSVLANQGIMGTELTAQVIIFSTDLYRLNVKAINSVLFCLEFMRLSP